MTKAPTIPYPDNPEHVDNLDSVSKLEAQGFSGPDVSLDISLGDYSLAWRYLDNGQILFVYQHPTMARRFDRCTIHKDTDPEKEWDWALKDTKDRNLFYEAFGTNRAQWLSAPLTRQVEDLVLYYGVENIFGSSYWEGFEIEGVYDDE